MNTIIQTSRLNVSTKTLNKVNVKTSIFTHFLKNAETNRFGIIPILLVLVVGFGAVAAATVVEVGGIQLAMVALFAMLVETLVVAVMPMRAIIIASIASFIISLAVIILNR